MRHSGKKVKTYKGHKNEKYCLTPAFVTRNKDKFVAMGSEDNQIYIWHVAVSETCVF